MPKGRGSNKRRTRRALQHRRGGGTQSGTLRTRGTSSATETITVTTEKPIDSFLERMRNRLRRKQR